MKPLLICNCLDLEIEKLYKNNYSYFDQYHTELLENDICKYKSIVIVGNFYIVPEKFKGMISWVITKDVFSNDCLIKGIYDKVDNFFISFKNNTIFSQLIDRFNKKYVHMFPEYELFLGNRIEPPRFISKNTINNLISLTLENLKKVADIRDGNLKKKLENGGFLTIKGDISKKNINKQIMFSISEDPSFYKEDDKYNNIVEKKNFKEKLKDSIEDYYKNYKLKNINEKIKIFNTNYIDKYYFYIVYLISEINFNIEKNIIIDTCVEKTFLYDYFIYKKNNKIPYNSEWIGVFVNPLVEESNYKLDYLFENKDFLYSLKYCKGFIVFTNYLSKIIKNTCRKFNISCPKIFNITYPLQKTGKVFCFDKFNNNSNRMIIQYNSNSCNNFSIYTLQLVKNNFITKAVFYDYFENKNIELEDKNINIFLEDIKNSVKIIIENDSIFENNIVFANIINCSIIPFLLDCISLNIPVIVNYHESLVEYFGYNYPLFYSSLAEATLLITDYGLIKKGYNYLLNLNKDIFSSEKFKIKIKEIIET